MGGTVVVAGELVAHAEATDAAWPYEPLDRPLAANADRTGIVLVRYHSWANRGPSTMRVWLPTAEPDPASGPEHPEERDSPAEPDSTPTGT